MWSHDRVSYGSPVPDVQTAGVLRNSGTHPDLGVLTSLFEAGLLRPLASPPALPQNMSL